MSDYDAKDLIAVGNKLFDGKKSLDSLWQELADHFYPERATFTVTRELGNEFASHLMTSAPVLARRDLGESFSSMLRRGQWFKVRAEREEWEDHQTKLWLDYATQVQFRAMNDRGALFKKSAKMADHDFATFGQAVIQVTLNRNRDGLLYRTWHLRDCAWTENADGVIDTLHRKWRPRADELVAMFGKKCHSKIRNMVESDRTGKKFKEVDVRHVMMPSVKKGFCSIYLDVENEHIIETVEMNRFEYVVPRWAMSGSQYAHSPAVMVGLPDARLIQQITLTLLEAGERYVNPPMVATQNAIRSDVQLFAGGVTWVDQDYDERLGEVLRPVSQDKSSFPVAFNIREQVEFSIKEAFYLNKISLPPLQGHDMTATEVRERVQEYIRQALPLFEPMEEEYNAAVCERTMDILLDNGAFGSVADMPQSLKGRDVRFQFDTPLQSAEDSENAQRFQEMLGLLQAGAQLDPTVLAEVDYHLAFREALQGVGAPEDWLLDERSVQKRVEEIQAAQQLQQMAQEAGAVREAVGG